MSKRKWSREEIERLGPAVEKRFSALIAAEVVRRHGRNQPSEARMIEIAEVMKERLSEEEREIFEEHIWHPFVAEMIDEVIKLGDVMTDGQLIARLSGEAARKPGGGQ